MANQKEFIYPLTPNEMEKAVTDDTDPAKDIYATEEIQIEEMSIDGICGVY